MGKIFINALTLLVYFKFITAGTTLEKISYGINFLGLLHFM